MPRALESSTYSTKLLFCEDTTIADGKIYSAYTLHLHGAFTWEMAANIYIYIYILMVYMYMAKI